MRSLLTCLVVVAAALPDLALARPAVAPEEGLVDKCRPARWLNDVAVAWIPGPRGKCPEVDEDLSRLIHTTKFVTMCGRARRCGKDFLWVRVAGRAFLAEARDIELLPYALATEQPEPADQPADEYCHLASIRETGADFFRLDGPPAAGTPVADVVRLRPETPLAVCRKLGPMALAYVHGDVGLVAGTALQLSNQRYPAAYWQEPGPYCRQPFWPAVARRDTLFHVPMGGVRGNDEFDGVAAGDEVEIVGLRLGRDGKTLWYEVGVAAVRGFLRAVDVELKPGVLAGSSRQAWRGCPAQAAKVRVTRPLLLHVERWLDGRKARGLPAMVEVQPGTELLEWPTREGRRVLLGNVVARPADSKALGAPQGFVELAIDRADLVAKISHDGADHQALWDGLPTGWRTVTAEMPAPEVPLPLEVSPAALQDQPLGTRTVGRAGEVVALASTDPSEATLRKAVAGDRPVRTVLHASVEKAVAVRASRRQPPELMPNTVARRITEAEQEAGRLLLANDPAGALQVLSGCIHDACENGTARYLMAEALLRMGYPATASELLLDVLQVSDATGLPEGGPLEHALRSYHEAVKRYAPSPRAVTVLRPWCDGTVTFDPEACFLGLQAALEVHDGEGAAPFAVQLRQMRATPKQRALLALYDVISRGRTEDGALGLTTALAQARQTCGPDSELVQALLLQTARASWEVGDYDAAWTAVEGLVDKVAGTSGDLVASVAVATGRQKAGMRLLERLEATSRARAPELVLWRARIDLDDCRFERALAAEAVLARQIQDLRKLAQGVTTSVQGPLLQSLRRLDVTLRQARMPSRQVGELDRLLKPTGTCGQWGQLQAEQRGLKERFCWGCEGMPPVLGHALPERLAAAERRCLHDLREAGHALQRRAAQLDRHRGQLALDRLELQVQELERAQRLVEALHAAALQNVVADWSQRGEAGEKWRTVARRLHRHKNFPIGDVMDNLAALGSQADRYAERAFQHLLEQCGAAQVPRGMNEAEAEIRRSVRCLSLVADVATDEEALGLLFRYLPALRLVRPESLQGVHLAAVPKAGQQQVAAWAHAAGTASDRCLPERWVMPDQEAERAVERGGGR